MSEVEKTFPAPVDWDELYPGRFMKAGEFKGKKPTLTIAAVKLHELVGDKGKQIKGVIYFQETEKQWALNKTNGICLREMFGRNVQAWAGHKVTLFAGTWDGDICIRVWGSPELEEDREVVIALPRKRPFNMTMHAVRKSVASGGATEGAKGGNGPAASTSRDAAGSLKTPPSIEEANRQLKAPETVADFINVKKSIWAVYAAANVEVPLDVEAYAHQRREDLESKDP